MAGIRGHLKCVLRASHMMNRLARMFESGGDVRGDLARLVTRLGRLDADVFDADRIELLRAMEQAKAALAAAQARVAAAFAGSQRAEQLAAGVAPDRAERGIAAQVALALRTSSWHAQRYLGWARILISELPCTYAAL